MSPPKFRSSPSKKEDRRAHQRAERGVDEGGWLIHWPHSFACSPAMSYALLDATHCLFLVHRTDENGDMFGKASFSVSSIIIPEPGVLVDNGSEPSLVGIVEVGRHELVQ